MPCSRQGSPSAGVVPCGICRSSESKIETKSSNSSGSLFKCKKKKKTAIQKCSNESCASLPSCLKSFGSDSGSDSKSSCSRENCQYFNSNSKTRKTCKATCSLRNSPVRTSGFTPGRQMGNRSRCKHLETEGGVFDIRPCPYDSEGGKRNADSDSERGRTVHVRRTTSMTKLGSRGSPCMLKYQNERQSDRNLQEGNPKCMKQLPEGPICPVAMYGGNQANANNSAPVKGGRSPARRNPRGKAGRGKVKKKPKEKKKKKQVAKEIEGKACWKGPKKPFWLRNPLTRRERKLVRKQLNYLACRHRVFFYTMRRRPCVCLYYLFPSIYPCFVQLFFFLETMWRCLLLTIAIIIWTPFFLLLMLLQFLFCTLFCCDCCP